MIQWVLLLAIALWANQEEFRRIEQAKYLFEMEGQSYRALKILNSLDSSKSPIVISKSTDLIQKINRFINPENQITSHEFIKWGPKNIDSSDIKSQTSSLDSNEEIIFHQENGFSISKTPTYYQLQYQDQTKQNFTKVPIGCIPLAPPINHYVYFQCPEGQVIRGNIYNTSEIESRRFEQLKSFIPSTFGFVIIQDHSVGFIDTFQGAISSSIPAKGIVEANVSPQLILLRSKNQISAYDFDTKELLWSKSNVSGDIYSFSNRFGLVQKNGFVQFFKDDGSFIWRLHFAQNIVHTEKKNDSTLVLQTNDRQIELYIHRDDAIYQWKDYTKNLISPTLKELDSLIQIEPGNIDLWETKITLLQKQKSNSLELSQAINTSIEIAQQLDNPKTHLLEDYNQTIGAFWLLDLKSKSGFHPKLFKTELGPAFVHSQTGNIIIINDKNGRIIRTSKDTVNIHVPLVSIKKDLISSFENKVQMRSLRTLEILREVSLKGEIKSIEHKNSQLLVETWEGQIYLLNPTTLKTIWHTQYSQNPILAKNITSDFVIALFSNGSLILNQIKTAQSRKLYLREKNITQARVEDKYLYITNEKNELFKISLQNFRVLWKQKLDAQVFSVEFQPTKILLGLSNQKVILLDKQNGQINWKWQGKNSLFIMPAIYKGKVYMDQGNELQILSLRDGKAMSAHYYPSEIGFPQILDSQLYLSTKTGILHSFQLK